MTTVGEAISRVRNVLKAVKEDPFVTDRQIYFTLSKYGKTLLKREDNMNKLMRMSTLITTLPFVELIDVDKIEAGCTGIYSGCTFKRTKEKLPLPFEGMFGPLFRTVTSIDSSQKLYKTDSALYTVMTKSTSFKYNRNIYYWYLNGYIYVANVDWDAIRIEGIFEGDTGDFLCEPEAQCTLKQDRRLPFPEYLFSEIEQFTIKELTLTLQIQDNGADDSQNPHR
jgi:hypothetical protein